MRVYTWSAKRSRYETAFIDNTACGQLPVRIGKGPNGEPEFRFHAIGGGKEDRVYRLVQTVVRRIPQGNESTKKPSARSAVKAASRGGKR